MSTAPNRVALGITNCRSAADVRARVEEAERLGAEIAFIAEDVNCRDSFELCVLASRATEKIRISTGVVNPYTRNPTSIAMAVATLDEISGGRAGLGIGSSSPSLIEDQMGMEMGRPARVMREATEIIRGLLAGECLTYQGERFSYREAKLDIAPIQERVPIFFAAMGPKTLQLAGELADGVILNVGASVDYVRWAVSEVRKGSDRAGRPHDAVTICAWLGIYLEEDEEKALANARRALVRMLALPGQGERLLEHSRVDPSVLAGIRAHYSAYPPRGDWEAAGEYITREIAEELSLVGPKRRIEERLGEYRTAGVEVPVLGPAALRALHS